MGISDNPFESPRCDGTGRPLLGSANSRIQPYLSRKAIFLALCAIAAVFVVVQLQNSAQGANSELVQKPAADGLMVKTNPKVYIFIYILMTFQHVLTFSGAIYEQMAYMYVKSSALRFDKTKNSEVFDMNDAKVLPGVPEFIM